MAAEPDKTNVKSVAIILAAGSSSRMGQSKQLLEIGNETLLQKTIRTVINSGVDETIVVLGADQQQHQKEITTLPVQIIFNPYWEKGIGSSLKFGIRFAEAQFQSCETVLVTVCDQPLLTSNHLKKLINTSHSKQSVIVASFYSGSPGVPVLFHRSMFKKILDIDDQQGAKKIIVDNIKSATLVDFPAGAVDLDTPEDWKNFSQSF